MFCAICKHTQACKWPAMWWDLPGSRSFPRMALPTVFGMSALSADGKFVTFTTHFPALATDADASQFRTYIYNVEQDSLVEIPMTSPAAPPSDPAPNADGSFVAFTGASAGIQHEAEPATHNIYLWERSTGQVTLLSQSHPGAFENTHAADSKISESQAFSDDAQKMVFASRASTMNPFDENGTWDVYL